MIPVFDSIRQTTFLEKELHAALKTVCRSGVLILGPHVAAFEEAFARYVGVSYAVGVASGTDAIMLSLLAIGIQTGDEVIMPANTYPSVFGVAAAGAVPKLVDIDLNSPLINISRIESAITKRTKAIMPVHLYGQTVDLREIALLAKKHNLVLIEDCAQAFGSKTYNLKPNTSLTPAGSVGDMGCFSFYPTKNIGALGDGGMIVTNNKEIYEKIKLLRMYGEKGRYNSILVGRNSRLDELQAAFLLVKMKHVDKWIDRRREIARLYTKLLSGIGDIRLPQDEIDGHSYHLYVIQTNKRDELKNYLEKNQIGTGIHYPLTIHQAPSFQYLGYKIDDFPCSETSVKEILSLPMFPELTDNEVEKVANVIGTFFT